VNAGIADARTFLFVPGDRPDRFGKAAASGADVVILDLEDAVSPDHKAMAREHVSRWLRQHQTVIRINGAGTPWQEDDIAMVAAHPGGVAAVMVPKVEDPELLGSLFGRLPPEAGMIPLIETAAGVTHAASLCDLPGVIRPAFGSLDLAAQLGVDHREHQALSWARSALVLAAAAAGCAGPIDGVTTDLADHSVLLADLDHALALGLTSKLCIHPSQVAIANRRLTPASTEVDWARSVVATARNGPVGLLGSEFVDRPVVLRAEAILARAARLDPGAASASR
jgi:citrate lyase subunit beta / citryl-CoA lyase